MGNQCCVQRELARDRTPPAPPNQHSDPEASSPCDKHPSSRPPAAAGFPTRENGGGGVTSILEFSRARQAGRPITIVTAYDVLQARLVAESSVDAILVGDSVAMVVHGYPSTVHATLAMMCLHTAAVRRGAGDKFIVADLPFLSFRRGREVAAEAAGALIQAGANAVKLEGVAGHEDVIVHLVGSGIPVMGHLGLTPQSVHQLGGHRVQGRTPDAAARLQAEARRLEELGAFSFVLECVPAALAAQITHGATIPTIGIGAGPDTDGQVLVITDLLGLDGEFHPRFARRYLDGHAAVLAALNDYAADVRGARFPAREEVPA
ncbi:MAG: 3-methyl-2-oxobutanoate hydroxymethyltransferase [Opitutae bacterium]|nr:3-methyl-2-oxobutanoate hydroxymethyltransferase [Opitutae bacterium]